MFCNHCGGQLQPGQAFCAACGKPVAGAPPPPVSGRLTRHLSTLGILWIVFTALRFVGRRMWMLNHIGFFPTADVWGRGRFVPLMFSMPAPLMVLMAIAGIAVGWGLLERRSWARVLALVLGALSLFDFPLGTALGVYTFWVLLSPHAEQEYQWIARRP